MTKSEQDYLKTLFELGGYEKYITNKLLSERLNISVPATIEKIKKLSQKDYLLYEPYKGTKLKKTGFLIALKVLRQHRIWEVFLSNKLGLSWDKVHKEAEILEHDTSELLEERLYNFLGKPKFCPHGNIIPDKDNYVDKNNFISLINIKENSIFKIYSVLDEEKLLKYLTSLEIELNKEYKLEKIQPYNGPFEISNNGKVVILSKEATKKINVLLK